MQPPLWSTPFLSPVNLDRSQSLFFVPQNFYSQACSTTVNQDISAINVKMRPRPELQMNGPIYLKECYKYTGCLLACKSKFDLN